MGGSASVPVENDQHQAINDESTNFHLFEIHSPTVGVGLALFAFVGFGACVLYAGCAKLKKKLRQGRQRNAFFNGRNTDIFNGGAMAMPKFPAVQYFPQGQQVPAYQQGLLPVSSPSVPPPQQPSAPVHFGPKEIQSLAKHFWAAAPAGAAAQPPSAPPPARTTPLQPKPEDVFSVEREHAAAFLSSRRQ